MSTKEEPIAGGGADDAGTVDAGTAHADAVEIMQNLQQLNDIEGDLAETAVAVAAEAPATAPAAEDASEAAPTDDAPTNDMAQGSTSATDPSNAVLQVAEGVEDVLEQNIPDAPAPAPQVSQAQLEVPPAAESSSVTPTPATMTSESAPPIDKVLETVKQDDEPILPADIRPLAALKDEATSDIATANADEIVIDDPSSSSTTVDVAPAETAAPDQTLSGQNMLQPTEDGYKPTPTPTPVPQATPAPAPSGAQTSTVKVEEKEKPAPVEQQKLDLPEGLTMTSPSVSQNRGLAQEWSNDPTNVNAILALYNWSIQRGEITDARIWYGVIAKENPTATGPLLALIDLESSLSNFPQVESLFATTLKSAAGDAVVAPSVGIWKAYLHYVRRQNQLVEGPNLEKTRQTITQGYEFALAQCGVDMDAGEIWAEYLAFVQGSNPKNHWEVQAQQDTLRKIYQRCVCIPVSNLEVLWKQYDAFESSINKATAKTYLASRSPAYMTARSALRELRQSLDTIRRLSGPVPTKPVFDEHDRQLLGAWKAYLKWEEGNPLVLEDEQLEARVGYAMKRCTAEMRHFPEMWHLVAQHYLAQEKEERGMAVLKAGVEACPKRKLTRSVLLTFAAAELAETLKDPALAHSLFTSLIDSLSTEASSLQAILEKEVAAAMGPEVPKLETGVPEDSKADTNGNDGNGMDMDEDAFALQSEYTRQVAEREQRGEAVEEKRGRELEDVKEAMGVVWVMYMRFARRSEGIKSARAVFGRARKSVWVSWHPFEASALMEYHSNKDQGVAVRIFELGFKSFPDSPDFIVRYVQFLLSVNDDNNARALFERSTLKMPAEKIRPLWEVWARYEYMYGDLAAVHKLEKRWAEAFPNDSSLKRFAQRYKYDDIDQIALRDLGLRSFERSRNEAHSRSASGSGPGAGPVPNASAVPVEMNLANNPSLPFQNPNVPPVAAAIPPHMAPQPAFAGGNNSPILNSHANNNNEVIPNAGGGNKRPHGTASQSPSRNVGPGGHGRPRGSIERSASPSRMGMGYPSTGLGLGPVSGPGPGPMAQGPGDRDNFVPNKRYRANSPRRGDGGGAGGAGGGRRQNKAGGRDTTPLGAPAQGPPGGRNFSGAGGPPMANAGPGMGGGGAPYGYTPREGYDRSGVGRSLAWFVGELPPARSFDGPVFRSDDIIGLFNNIAPDGGRVGGSGPGGPPAAFGQGPGYAFSQPPPMGMPGGGGIGQQGPPMPMRAGGGGGYGGPGPAGYGPPGGGGSGRRY